MQAHISNRAVHAIISILFKVQKIGVVCRCLWIGSASSNNNNCSSLFDEWDHGVRAILFAGLFRILPVAVSSSIDIKLHVQTINAKKIFWKRLIIKIYIIPFAACAVGFYYYCCCCYCCFDNIASPYAKLRVCDVKKSHYQWIPCGAVVSATIEPF